MKFKLTQLSAIIFTTTAMFALWSCNPGTQQVKKGELHVASPTNKQIAMMWVDAYNSHDPDAAVALYDENVTNVQLPWGKSVHGREAMRATYLKVFQAFPDIRVEVDNLLEDGPWVVVEWRFSGTMRGEFAGHSPNNNSFNMRGCEMFQIVGGKILVQHGYWDKATMFDQLKIGSGL